MTPPLPPKATQKLALMRVDIDEAKALENADLKSITEMQRDLANNSKNPDRPHIEVALATRKGKHAAHHQQCMSASAVYAQVVTDLKPPPKGFVLIDAPEQPLKLRDGERIDEAVGRLRIETIFEVQTEMKRVRTASSTWDEKYALAQRYMGDLLAQAKPRLVSTHDRVTMEFSGPNGITSHPNPVAVLAWQDPDAFLARLHAEIDAQPEPELALTAAEKRDRLAKLEADLLTAEREEEALIERAAALGTHIERRRNANPMAVLGVMFAPEPDDKPAI